mmetsp:Transcript_18530/g.28459  ORF Transcript_18530/g.28459 Transcript_18530/m.28459 type:complete len:175 (+) Transcript_18530:294-818(+)
MIGFLFSAGPTIYFFSVWGTTFGDDPANPIPTWFFNVQAASYFFARLFDEMDGKQARKTGNSSPLGLLFDHGCDSLTVGIQGLLMIRCLLISDNVFIYLCMCIICLTFHGYTLEEYWVGWLKLGRFNAVSDGSVLVIGHYLILAYFGNTFWADILIPERNLSAGYCFVVCILIW